MMHKKPNGFTLIELMIVVVIVAILAAIALPSFQASIRKSRRADAHAFLQAAQLAQEKFRLNNTTYFASNVHDFSGASADFGRVCANGTIANCTSENRYYVLTSTVGTGTDAGTTFTLTATAIGSQARDTHCANISFAQTGTTMTYGGTSTDCWGK